MFKSTINMMKLNIKITPQTPLLVASGKTFDVICPDMQFVNVKTDYGETVYVPGSSIKGVLRDGMEAMLGENERWRYKICFASGDMCNKKHKNNPNEKVPYRLHCPVCRIFGSGDLASRLKISDVFPYDFEETDEKKKKKIEALQSMLSSRTGIRIDRRTGKTYPRALFEYEILGGGELFGEFTFTNYELYQPGLLFTLFDLSNEGFLRYGHSKSRGLGVLNFDICSMTILQFGKLRGEIIKGVGFLPKPDETDNDYGFYMKGNDQLDKEFLYEDKILYSTFHFTEKEPIREVTGLFKKKIETFLA